MFIHPITRRAMLREGASVLALPFLPSLLPAAEEKKAAAIPKRFLMVHFAYGVTYQDWHPVDSGPNWTMSRSLKPFAEVRDQMTVFRGVSLVRGITSGTNGHGMAHDFGTVAHRAKGSIDQVVAASDEFGPKTRFSSLTCAAAAMQDHSNLSYSLNHTPIPVIPSPVALYQKLFVAEKVGAAVITERLARKQSMLDVLNERVKSLGQKLNAEDRNKLDEYLVSIRSLEEQIAKDRYWMNAPLPKTDVKKPEAEADMPSPRKTLNLFTSLIRAAFQTDQTRVISYAFANQSFINSEGQRVGYHTYTHHQGNKVQMEELALQDILRNEALADLLRELRATKERDGSCLLDHTLVLYGSSCENANVHQAIRLPLLTFGMKSRFQHGSCHGYEFGQHGLADVAQTLFHGMGINSPKYADSTPGKGVPMPEILA
ncbi:MAG: DUF1552 domain-containing protein [Planctomycetia bacterium]|nr:DUF1552 domain-containing protein [Planctomycetia bacterium]